MATDFDSLARYFSSSSLIHFCDAREVAAQFGGLVAELNDPKRYTLADLEMRRTFSFPVETLGYSKQQVQIALAVLIAELVFRMAIDPSERDGHALYAAMQCSGHLAHFTHQPERGWQHIHIEIRSTYVYACWQARCQRCLTEITPEPRRLREDTGRWLEALTTYWQRIDLMVPDLLNDTTLVAIRAT
jgi:hypothetical protein